MVAYVLLQATDMKPLPLRIAIRALGLACAFTTASAAAAAQAGPPAAGQSAPDGKPGKPLIITGCVTADGSDTDRYTLKDSKAGIAYRLKGLKVFAYEGRRVRIVGGLYPSANIAAQAGSIDPTQAAMAATAGGRSVGMPLPQPLEFQVTELRPVRGSCPPLR